MMFCPRSLYGIKRLPVLGFSVLLVIVLALPSFAADKVRVAFSAVSPSQGVLWVAEVGGLLPKNGISAEIIYTRAAIETLVAGEVDFAQMTGSLMSSARLQGADPVMIAGVQDILEDRLVARPNIKSMEDLRGKRIGVFRFGAASHLRLIYVLPRYGLSSRDVTLLQVGDTPERLIALIRRFHRRCPDLASRSFRGAAGRHEDFTQSARFEYCVSRQWAGHDPAGAGPQARSRETFSQVLRRGDPPGEDQSRASPKRPSPNTGKPQTRNASRTPTKLCARPSDPSLIRRSRDSRRSLKMQASGFPRPRKRTRRILST